MSGAVITLWLIGANWPARDPTLIWDSKLRHNTFWNEICLGHTLMLPVVLVMHRQEQ